MRKPALGVVLLLLALPAVAQRDFSKVEIKAEKVAGSVYMLTGAGGNIGVSVGKDGIVMVDDQFLPLAGKIEGALKDISERPLRFVINTHYHGDHVGGNPHFGEEAPIVAQENVRKRLAEDKENPMDPKGLPIVTFNEQLSIHLNGEEIRAIHLPHGHTDGDSVIHFTGSNVVHMGDDFFNGVFPFIDLDAGGSVQGVMAAAEAVLEKAPDDVKIIPGHGPLGDKATLRTFLTMLTETSAAVTQEIDAGKSLEQVKSEAPELFSKYESWGHGFIDPPTWAEILYRSLSKKKMGGPNPHNSHGHVGGAR